MDVYRIVPTYAANDVVLDKTNIDQYLVQLLLDFWRCRNHREAVLVRFQHP